MAGYIKAYRDIQEHWVWADKPFSKGQAWIDIVFRCNHVCRKVVGYGDIKWVLRGQFVSSNYKLAEAWGWSESSVRKFIKLLVKDSMITATANKNYTLYEVVNYCVYQSIDITELQQKSNAQKTHSKRTPHAQRTPNNNDNNYKTLKEIINIYATDPKLNSTLLNFLDMRIQKKKVPTDKAMELIINTLKPFDIETQIQMLEKSIKSGWTDVYPPNEPKKMEAKKSNRDNFEQRDNEYSGENFFSNVGRG